MSLLERVIHEDLRMIEIFKQTMKDIERNARQAGKSDKDVKKIMKNMKNAILQRIRKDINSSSNAIDTNALDTIEDVIKQML